MTDYKPCPNEHIDKAFRLWVEYGQMPGSFVTACLTNNLMEACFRADSTNIALLPAIVKWMYWELPSGCWGSKEKVRRWSQKLKAEVVV